MSKKYLKPSEYEIKFYEVTNKLRDYNHYLTESYKERKKYKKLIDKLELELKELEHDYLMVTDFRNTTPLERRQLLYNLNKEVEEYEEVIECYTLNLVKNEAIPIETLEKPIQRYVKEIKGLLHTLKLVRDRLKDIVQIDLYRQAIKYLEMNPKEPEQKELLNIYTRKVEELKRRVNNSFILAEIIMTQLSIELGRL